MQFGLSDKVIKQLQNIFSQYEDIEKVTIYGSRAKGNYRKGSDIDLVFYGNNLNQKIIYSIEEDIEELYLPYLFDIAIFSHIKNKELIEHIQRVGKIFYERKNISKS
jgi:predicted nucleotidyltransferase